ncbi:MAG: tetratricopeptide repeat protein [bacterium]
MSLSKIFSNNPSERTENLYIETIRKYNEKGKIAIALKTAEEALHKYPDSDKIQKIYETIEKESIINQCTNLEVQIAEKPSPAAFAKLGNIYYKIGNIERAIEICKEGERRFPEYGGNNLILGSLYYDQYQKSMNAEDAIMAIEYIEKALKHGIDNKKAYFDLINIYLDIGAYGKAKKKIYRYQDLFPDDADVKNLLDQVNDFKGNEQEENIEELCKKNIKKLDDIENDKECKELENIIPSSDIYFQSLIDNLQIFDTINWASSILLIDDNGFVLSSKLSNKLPEDLAGASINKIFQTANQFIQNIFFGEFESCIIEGEQTDIYINSVNKMLFCLITQGKEKQGIVKAYIKKYLESV